MRKLWIILLLISLMPLAALADIPDAEAAAMRYPGYTMASYYDGAWMGRVKYATVEYYRLADGLLHRRTAYLYEDGREEVADCMPVPVTMELISLLAREEVKGALREYGWIGDLLYQKGYARYVRDGHLAAELLTADGIDRSRIPLEGVINNIDLQSKALIVLTRTSQEESYLYVYTYDEASGAFAGRRSGPWPATTILNNGEGDGRIVLDWDDRIVSYVLHPDGEWRLRWEQDFASGVYEGEFYYFGVHEYGEWHMTVGTIVGQSLFSGVTGDALFDEPLTLDRAGWARISIPEGANLWESPGGKSLGIFFSGTPVRILEEAEDWLWVSIGQDGLTGWLRRDDLVFGEAMDVVEYGFPDLIWKDAYYTETDRIFPAYTTIGMAEQGWCTENSYWIVGEREDAATPLYILLDDDGSICCVLKDWMFPGNG